MTRKVYDQEFKKTIVFLLKTGKTVVELCSEYGIGQASVNRWRKQYDNSNTRRPNEDTEKEQRIKTLEKELNPHN